MSEVDDVSSETSGERPDTAALRKTRKGVTTKLIGGAAVLMAGAAVLAACGGGTTSGKPVSSSGANATATSSASPGAGGRFGGLAQLLQEPQVKQCLAAAGIPVPSLPARPSGAPSGDFRTRFPSGFPSGSRPSGLPSGARPSGFAGGGARGAFGQDFQKIQSALTACGIQLPTFSRPAQPPAPPASSSAASG